jgi:hypothetical protein
MANLVIRPFQPDDYAAIAPAGWQAGQGPAYTATVDGKVAGCAGIAIADYGAWGTAWAVLGPLGRQHGVFISRAVKRGLRAIISAYGLRRVEADVLADHRLARYWVVWLGFQEEGTMPLRGPNGSPMVRYVLFPKTEPDASAAEWVARYTGRWP